MFNKLNKRIFGSIFWLALVFVVVMSVLSGYVILNNFYDTYTHMMESNVKQAALDSENYFRSVSNFTRSTAQRREVVQALTLGQTDVSRVLNTLCTSSAEISGAILYGVDGRVFYSTGVGDVPALSEVLQDEQLQHFFDGNDISCVVIRNTALPKVYNTYPYDPNNGVVSCICKVYSGRNVIGYLFADILSAQLFANKLTISGYASTQVVLRSDDVAISSQGANSKTPMGDIGVSWDNNFSQFRVTTQFNGDNRLIVFVSGGYYWLRFAIVVGSLLVADIICMLAVWKVARSVANKITVPLDDLHAQMKKEELL